MCEVTEDYNVGMCASGVGFKPLFVLCINEVTKEIQGNVPWCMMFADDIVSVGENLKEAYNRLDE